ncbi:MAG: hypothetical protein ACE5DM_04900 [Candidatus Nanoarchaeia archaeon]
MKTKRIQVGRLVHKIRYSLSKVHRLRKRKDGDLPPWKARWNTFNEEKLGPLEHFVDHAIPWMVLLLLFIVLGEFSGMINIYDWAWLAKVELFFHQQEFTMDIIDEIIVVFFIVDLYFNFFKKASTWRFMRTSFLDILAVAPLGLIFRITSLSEAQSILHVTLDVEREAVGAARGTETVAKMQRAGRLPRILKIIARIPRLIRLYRILDLFRKRRK